MTANQAEVVHVWVINGESPRPLFEDICGMVRHLVARGGGSLEEIEGESGPASQHYFGRLGGQEAQAEVRREGGVRRSQTVPEGSPSGGVVTTLVGVELLPSALAACVGRPEGSVLKTYNYIQRKVTVHASGRQLRLEAALRGEA